MSKYKIGYKYVWKEMTLDEVKAVQVGDKIRIDGVEDEVAYLYNRANDDYGFRCYKNHDGSTTISHPMVAEMQCKFEKLVEEEEMNTGLERDKEYIDNYLDKLFPKIETEDQRKLRELKEKHAELGKAIEAMEKKVMNIQELADLIGSDIVVRYYPNQAGRWCCSIEGVEIVDVGCLVMAFENGKTPEAAIEGYANRLSGKQIKHEGSYFTVPTLTY